METIVVWVIVAVVLSIAAGSLYRMLAGKGKGCGCGKGTCSATDSRGPAAPANVERAEKGTGCS